MKTNTRNGAHQRCEACAKRTVQRPRERFVEGSPAFKLCHPCEDRMNQQALRPLEWYRLALLHGPDVYALSEEHYSDGGVALSCGTEYEEEPDVLRAPVLADVRDDLGSLWNHTLTRRHLKPKLLAAWRAHPKAAVVAHLMKIWNARRDARARGLILALCTACVGRAGADLVRQAWAEYSHTKPKTRTVRMLRREESEFNDLVCEALFMDDMGSEADDDDSLSQGRRRVQEENLKRTIERAGRGPGEEEDDGCELVEVSGPTRAGIEIDALARASAACLPEAEGFARVVRVVEAAREGRRCHQVYLLTPFGSTRTLDWIEGHVESPVIEEWGAVAALSSLDWTRVMAWLAKGRPLSHVALDALQRLICECGEPLSENHGVRLIDPPSRKTLRKVLKAHLARDPAPRVKDRVEFVLEHPDVLLEGKPYE